MKEDLFPQLVEMLQKDDPPLSHLWRLLLPKKTTIFQVSPPSRSILHSGSKGSSPYPNVEGSSLFQSSPWDPQTPGHYSTSPSTHSCFPYTYFYRCQSQEASLTNALRAKLYLRVRFTANQSVTRKTTSILSGYT